MSCPTTGHSPDVEGCKHFKPFLEKRLESSGMQDGWISHVFVSSLDQLHHDHQERGDLAMNSDTHLGFPHLHQRNFVSKCTHFQTTKCLMMSSNLSSGELC